MFSCIKFFRSRDVPTQTGIPAIPCWNNRARAPCIKFLSETSQGRGLGYPKVWVPDVPGISCPITLSCGCFLSVLIMHFCFEQIWQDIEAHKPPKTPKYQQNTAFTRTFAKSSRELCLLPCDAIEQLSGNCSEKLVQMDFYIVTARVSHKARNPRKNQVAQK